MLANQNIKNIKSHRNNQIVILVIGIFTIIISSVKWRTGTDWPAYVDIYSNIESASVLNDSLEPGFVILTKLMKLISHDFSFYIVIMSTIIIGLKFFAIAKLRYPVTGLILYLISFQFNIFFVRYDLALSIVLFCLAMGYSTKGNVGSYIFVTIFHKVGLAYALIDGIGTLLSNSVAKTLQDQSFFFNKNTGRRKYFKSFSGGRR